jgi:Mg2+ and Co2+ transporter CorA
MAADTGPSTDYNAPWAKEITLAGLLASSHNQERLLSVLAKQAGAQDSDIAGALDRLADVVNDPNRPAETRSRESLITETARLRYEFTSSINKMDGILGGDHTSVFSRLNEGMFSHVKGLENATEAEIKFAGQLGMVLDILQVFWSRVNSLTETIMDLSQAGISVPGGMIQLTNAVGDSGISLKEFAAALSKNSAAITVLGTARAVKLGQQFRDMTNGGLDMNMSMTEATDTLYSFADMTRTQGRLSTMSNQQLLASAKEFGTNLDAVSQLTGKRRDQLRDEIRENIKAPNISGYLMTLSEPLRQQFTQNMPFLSAFGAETKHVTDMMIGFSTLGFGGLSKADQQLVSWSGTQQELINLNRAMQGTSQEDIKAARRAYEDKIQYNARLTAAYASEQSERGEYARQLQKMNTELETARQNENKARESLGYDVAAQKATQNELNKAIGKLSTTVSLIAIPIINLLDLALRPLSAAFSLLITPVNSLLSIIGTLVEAFSSAVDLIIGPVVEGLHWLADAVRFDDWPKSFQDVISLALAGGGVAAIAMAASKIVPGIMGLAISKIMSFLAKPLAMLGIGRQNPIAGGGGGAGGPGMFGSMASGFGDLLKGAASSLGAVITSIANTIQTSITALGTGLGQALRGFSVGLAPFLQAIGKGAGAVLEGVLGGIGRGIAALGSVSPSMFARGLAYVTAIGASLEGLVFLGSKTVPSLVEALQLVQTLDGDALVKAGTGMESVAKGISLIAGSTVANSFSAIANWFMGVDILDALKKLGETAEPVMRAGLAMEKFGPNFKIFGDALKTLTVDPEQFDRLRQALAMIAAPRFIDSLNKAAVTAEPMRVLGTALETFANGYLKLIDALKQPINTDDLQRLLNITRGLGPGNINQTAPGMMPNPGNINQTAPGIMPNPIQQPVVQPVVQQASIMGPGNATTTPDNTTPATTGGTETAVTRTAANAQDNRRHSDNQHRDSLMSMEGMNDKLQQLIDAQKDQTRILARAFQQGAGLVY